MPRLTVTNRAGGDTSFEFAAGATLMAQMRDAGTADVFGICGGACSCATCHVIVAAPWFGRLGAIGADEAGLLEGSEFYVPGSSRLACQIRLTAALDGLHVVIAPEG